MRQKTNEINEIERMVIVKILNLFINLMTTNKRLVFPIIVVINNVNKYVGLL
jgi:hypothetical protein